MSLAPSLPARSDPRSDCPINDKPEVGNRPAPSERPAENALMMQIAHEIATELPGNGSSRFDISTAFAGEPLGCRRIKAPGEVPSQL